MRFALLASLEFGLRTRALGAPSFPLRGKQMGDSERHAPVGAKPSNLPPLGTPQAAQEPCFSPQ